MQQYKGYVKRAIDIVQRWVNCSSGRPNDVCLACVYSGVIYVEL